MPESPGTKAHSTRKQNETIRRKKLAQITSRLIAELGKTYPRWQSIKNNADALGELADGVLKD